MIPEFNMNSNDHLSILFFGGSLTIKVKEPIMNIDGTPTLIKSGENEGNIKLHIIEKQIKIKGLGLNPLDSWKTKKEGIYQTNKTVLEMIAGVRDED